MPKPANDSAPHERRRKPSRAEIAERARRRRRLIVVGGLAGASLAAALWWLGRLDPFTEPHVRLMKQRVALVEEVNALIESAKDRQSAAAAAKSLAALAPREAELQIRAKQLGPPQGAVAEQIKTEWRPKLDAASDRTFQLLNALPKDLRPTLSRAFDRLYEDAKAQASGKDAGP